MKKEIELKGRVARSSALSPYTTIYLIRHCQPNYALKDKVGDFGMPLSRTGINEAERLAHHLGGLGIQAVYSSAMERSRQSAEIFLRHKRCRYEIDESLNEFDWNRWYRVKYFNIDPEKRGENIKDVPALKRLLVKEKEDGRMAIARIIKANKGKTVAVFTHGNFIRSVLTGILDCGIFGFLSMEIFQGSISKLVVDSGGNVIISYLNSLSHLPHRPVLDRFLSRINP